MFNLKKKAAEMRLFSFNASRFIVAFSPQF